MDTMSNQLRLAERLRKLEILYKLYDCKYIIALAVHERSWYDDMDVNHDIKTE
jgi:hypothetical protein